MKIQKLLIKMQSFRHTLDFFTRQFYCQPYFVVKLRHKIVCYTFSRNYQMRHFIPCLLEFTICIIIFLHRKQRPLFTKKWSICDGSCKNKNLETVLCHCNGVCLLLDPLCCYFNLVSRIFL